MFDFGFAAEEDSEPANEGNARDEVYAQQMFVQLAVQPVQHRACESSLPKRQTTNLLLLVIFVLGHEVEHGIVQTCRSAHLLTPRKQSFKQCGRRRIVLRSISSYHCQVKRRHLNLILLLKFLALGKWIDLAVVNSLVELVPG